MVLEKVQWYVADVGQEARRRELPLATTRDAPLAKAGNTIDISALPWKSGIEQ